VNLPFTHPGSTINAFLKQDHSGDGFHCCQLPQDRQKGLALETGILKTEEALDLSERQLAQSSDWLRDKRLKFYSLHSKGILLLIGAPKFDLELLQHNKRVPGALFLRIKLEELEAHINLERKSKLEELRHHSPSVRA
jgi:hypothetical protein